MDDNTEFNGPANPTAIMQALRYLLVALGSSSYLPKKNDGKNKRADKVANKNEDDVA